MIDFHCHILPGIDDGAKDWAESLATAQYLSQQGVTGVVATPHYMEGFFTPSAAIVLPLVGELQERINQAGITLQIYPGCEAQLTPDLPELVQQGQVLTINNQGKYLLVELPFYEIPRYTEDILFRLRLAGVTPILAHPERNEELARDIDQVAKLVNQGCLIQLNLGSLHGMFGSTAEKAARKLLKRGLVHVVGSDMHGMEREVRVAEVMRGVCIRDELALAILKGGFELSNRDETACADNDDQVNSGLLQRLKNLLKD